MVDKTEIVGETNIANEFKNSFTTIGAKLVQKIHNQQLKAIWKEQNFKEQTLYRQWKFSGRSKGNIGKKRVKCEKNNNKSKYSFFHKLSKKDDILLDINNDQSQWSESVQKK